VSYSQGRNLGLKSGEVQSSPYPLPFASPLPPFPSSMPLPPLPFLFRIFPSPLHPTLIPVPLPGGPGALSPENLLTCQMLVGECFDRKIMHHNAPGFLCVNLEFEVRQCINSYNSINNV
jgi:hypothetical protein